MIKLVRLESDGRVVYINPDAVIFIEDEKYGGGCRIVFADAQIRVSESADEVAAIIMRVVGRSGDNAQ